MIKTPHLQTYIAIFLLMGAALSCGRSKKKSVNNTLAVSVNTGPDSTSVNVPYVSVEICVPNTKICQVISDIIVDTGSTGLRILDSVITIPLPQSTDSSNNNYANCVQFAGNSYGWGPIKTADVYLAGEVASSQALQVINVPGFASVSAASGCAISGGTNITSSAIFGGNGLIGVGLAAQDCGEFCVSNANAASAAAYFSCTKENVCTPVGIPLHKQLQNVVTQFPQDNNGLILSLDAIAPDGASTGSGTLTFGIGTQSNNQLGNAKVYTANDSGFFTSAYGQFSFPKSYVDSGTTNYEFLTVAESGMPLCSSPDFSGFYCPTTTKTFTIKNTGANNESGTTTILVSDALDIVVSDFSAFNLATPGSGSIVLGAPFFYGRNVFVGISGQSAGSATGPFWAF